MVFSHCFPEFSLVGPATFLKGAGGGSNTLFKGGWWGLAPRRKYTRQRKDLCRVALFDGEFYVSRVGADVADSALGRARYVHVARIGLGKEDL